MLERFDTTRHCEWLGLLGIDVIGSSLQEAVGLGEHLRVVGHRSLWALYLRY